MKHLTKKTEHLVYGGILLLTAQAAAFMAEARPRVFDGYIEVVKEEPKPAAQATDASPNTAGPDSNGPNTNGPNSDDGQAPPNLSAFAENRQPAESPNEPSSNNPATPQPNKSKLNNNLARQQAEKPEVRVQKQTQARSQAEKPATEKPKSTASTKGREREDKKANTKAKPSKKSGTKSTTVDVNITGLSGDLEENARAFLTLARKDAVVRTRYQLRRQAKRGIAEIQNAIKVYGYYNSKVKAEVDTQSEPWTVNYDVTPGPQTKVVDIQISATGPGNQLEELQAAIADPTMAVGDALSHRAYEREKAILKRAAYNAGYLNAKYEKRELRVNPKTNEAVIALQLETGPLFQFGEVIFEQSVIKPKLMRAFVPFETGDTFSTDKLVALQLALNDTRYFSRVDVDVDRDAAKPMVRDDSAKLTAGNDADGSDPDNLAVGNDANGTPDVMRIPVQVKTFPGKPKSYKFGIGWGTDTGTRSTIGYENRRLNRSGHQFNTEIRLSEQTTTAAARYSLPVLNPGTDKLSFDARYVNDNPASGKSIQQTIGARLDRNGLRWRRSLYVDFTRESFQLGDESSKSQLLIPGATVTWVNTTDRLRPAWGLRLSADLHGSIEGPLTDTTFAQTRLESDVIRALSKRWRLLQRNRLVYSWLGDDFSSLPASQRLFAGGTGSVRGYGFQDLSPRDEDGNRIGGRHLYTASIEAEYQWAKSWASSVFVDAGNASQTFLDDMKYGVGIGMRWILPFGQARLDIAMPIGDENEDSPRVHISIGPDL